MKFFHVFIFGVILAQFSQTYAAIASIKEKKKGKEYPGPSALQLRYVNRYIKACKKIKPDDVNAEYVNNPLVDELFTYEQEKFEEIEEFLINSGPELIKRNLDEIHRNYATRYFSNRFKAIFVNVYDELCGIKVLKLEPGVKMTKERMKEIKKSVVVDALLETMKRMLNIFVKRSSTKLAMRLPEEWEKNPFGIMGCVHRDAKEKLELERQYDLSAFEYSIEKYLREHGTVFYSSGRRT